MSIYSSNEVEFKPTYLYIKQHKITGKLYFGKTTKTGRDFEKYTGSGTHWVPHIKKHGIEHVDNLWYCLFLDKETLIEFAVNFSRMNNIVESTEWLNKIEENGVDGFPVGHKGHVYTDEQKLHQSNVGKEVWNRSGYRDSMRIKRKEQANRPEVKEKQRKNSIDRKWSAAQREKMMDILTNDEFRNSTSIRMKELIRTDIHCQRISNSLKGKSKSEDHIRKTQHSKWIKHNNLCRISDKKLMTLKEFLRTEKWKTVDGRKKSEEHKNKIVWATHNMLCVLQTKEIVSRKKFLKSLSLTS